MKSNKRLLSVFLSLAVMLTMCMTTAAAIDADDGSVATITVEAVQQAVHENDVVTLNVSIANNPGFWCMTLPSSMIKLRWRCKASRMEISEENLSAIQIPAR